ncbi:hypothetical protein BC830DRAFT_94981 [Chytriomyces sp. MP71]|nr:hypothetical protein BC830DRAFT_94981 [Chytriomyces sp. MP71]
MTSEVTDEDPQPQSSSGHQHDVAEFNLHSMVVLLSEESPRNDVATSAAALRTSITSDRLPPINTRSSLTGAVARQCAEIENQLIQSEKQRLTVEDDERSDGTTNRIGIHANGIFMQHGNSYERNVATHLPSSNHTSRYIYHTHQVSPPYDALNEETNKEFHRVICKDKSGGDSEISRHRDHRRVASARTSREQDYQQAKGASKRNAAIAAVKKTLNFGFAGGETPTQLDSSASVAVFDDKEKKRIMAIYGMRILNGPKESRFDVITSLTSRLLNSDICSITIVDASVIRFWSICDNTNGKYFSYNASSDPSNLHELRSDSFCQYTIRDDDEKLHNGFVVLDASREPKFKHRPWVKEGLHFYAGAPLITRAGVKIGALSIRGPARQQFTSQEAKILRQMTEWAAGELELYIAKRELDFREALRLAQVRLGEVRENLCGVGWSSGRGVLKQSIDIIKNSLKLKNVMILKIKKNSSGAIRSTVFALSEKCDIKPGEEKFTELCQATLDKPGFGPFILDRSHSVASQLQVCRYIGENVRQSASELIWSHGRPVGALIFFFDGIYKTVSPLEENFLVSSATTISSIWEHMETHDSLSKVMCPSANAQLLVMQLKKLASSHMIRDSIKSTQEPMSGASSIHILTSIVGNSSSVSSLPRHASKSPRKFPLIRSNQTVTSQSILTLRQSENSLNQLGNASLTTTLHQRGLIVCVLVCEPVIPPVKGNTVSESCHKISEAIARGYGTAAAVAAAASGFIGSGTSGATSEGSEGGTGNPIRRGSFGSIRAASLNGKNVDHDGSGGSNPLEGSSKSRMGSRTSAGSSINNSSHPRLKSNGSRKDVKKESLVAGPIQSNSSIWGGTSASISLTPKGAIDLFADFSQMFEVVAEQRGIKCVRKYGNMFMAVTGLLDDNLTCNNLINMAIDLSQTLAEYSMESGINVKARIGIHGEYIPHHGMESPDEIENAWTSLGELQDPRIPI